MHLVETYATNAGVKIGKPFIYEKYIPTSADKYIIFQPHSKPAKSYDYWQDVIELLLPTFNANGISIIQIGSKNERVYGGVINYTGHTDINQCAYLVRNSIGILGVDSFLVHIASSLNKPIVALYSNNNTNNVGPYWGDKSKQILLEPKRKKGERPNYALEESPKSINTIPCELIAKSICQLLDIPFDFKYNTIHTGETYYARALEIIPDQPVAVNQFGIDSVMVRMDYLHNELVLSNQFNFSKVSIVTNKPININLLTHFAKRIDQFIFLVEENNFDKDFLDAITNLGIKYLFLSYLNKEELNKVKFYYMDYGLIFEKPSVPYDEIKDYNVNNLFYKSNKFILARSKIYPSYQAWKLDLPIPSFSQTILPIHQDFRKEFWREREHFSYLVEKN